MTLTHDENVCANYATSSKYDFKGEAPDQEDKENSLLELKQNDVDQDTVVRIADQVRVIFKEDSSTITVTHDSTSIKTANTATDLKLNAGMKTMVWSVSLQADLSSQEKQAQRDEKSYFKKSALLKLYNLELGDHSCRISLQVRIT